MPSAVDTGVHDCNCMTCFLRMLFSLGVYASLSRRVQLVIIGWQLRPSHTHSSKRSLAAGGVNLDTTPLLQSVNEFVLMPHAAKLVVAVAQINTGDCNGHFGSSQAA